MVNNFKYQTTILKDNNDMELFCKDKKPIFVDAFVFQLKELFFIDNISYIGVSKDKAYTSDDYKKYIKNKENDYVYVYYHWNNHLVKTAKKGDYFKLKTNRNQDLITSEEQKRLCNKKIAILGMSVGSNIAFAITQAGISNKIAVADFDELDTTNLNRILSGVHEVGLNKTHVVARKIYEGNPFAEVQIMPEGVNKNNFEHLLKNGGLDLIIEEVDSLPFKIESRLLAIQYKIPVMMITDNGDGVILHVERYDLGHSKIFGKSPEYWKQKIKQGPLSKEEMGKLIMTDIVGGIDKVDPRMIISVKRVIKNELVSWPQLGSAALLAGVVGTIFTKRILLGENIQKDIRTNIFISEKNLNGHE